MHIDGHANRDWQALLKSNRGERRHFVPVENTRSTILTSQHTPFRNTLLLACLLSTAGLLTVATRLPAQTRRPSKPNFLVIFIDDMGYADPSCFGNPMVKTPRIDKLAEQGIKLTQFYVNSPICSPSRTALTTGQYPGRWKIHSYLASRKANRARGMAQWLDTKAPTTARILQAHGYATAHFGKWHMGGGRDVNDAPEPREYGFDESWVDTMEGMGPGQSRRSMPKQVNSDKYVDHAIDFMRRNKDRPFYLRMFPNDMHDRHIPKSELLEKYKKVTNKPFDQKFFAVLENLDTQIGRLVDEVDRLGLAERTLILFTSDNGPTDWPHYYKQGQQPPGYTGPFFGRKWSLFEGGIRMPFIARWKGVIKPGTTDNSSVLCALDILPTLCALAGVDPTPTAKCDGIDLHQVLLGSPQQRRQPIYWQYGAPHARLMPGNRDFISPSFAVRDGDWKLLINPDGSRCMLFNLANDIGEQHNLAASHPERVADLRKKLRAWIQQIGYTVDSI